MSTFHPWQFVLVTVAGWINRHQQDVMFLKAHWMIFFGEESLRRAISEFVAHYHRERHHQGLGNRLIDPEDSGGATAGEVHCRERLGGMLRYYYRAAA